VPKVSITNAVIIPFPALAEPRILRRPAAFLASFGIGQRGSSEGPSARAFLDSEKPHTKCGRVVGAAGAIPLGMSHSSPRPFAQGPSAPPTVPSSASFPWPRPALSFHPPDRGPASRPFLRSLLPLFGRNLRFGKPPAPRPSHQPQLEVRCPPTSKAKKHQHGPAPGIPAARDGLLFFGGVKHGGGGGRSGYGRNFANYANFKGIRRPQAPFYMGNDRPLEGFAKLHPDLLHLRVGAVITVGRAGGSRVPSHHGDNF